VLLVYVALVPDELANWARATSFELAERYGGRPSPFAPHITLKVPFETDDADTHARYLDGLPQRVALDVEVGGYLCWEGGYVVLDVRPQEPLRAVQQRLLDDLGLPPLEFEGPDFHFHLTLLADVEPDALARAGEELGDSPRWQFPLERFALGRKSGDQWLTYRLSSR
jgi:2'-5' RNA ligase